MARLHHSWHFRSGDPFQHELKPDNNDLHWLECVKLVKDYDDDRCTRWKDEINYLLIFAGLFSAVVTAFFIETLKLLQEDPQTTAALILAQIAHNMTDSSQALIPTSLEPFSLTTQSIRINTFAVLSLVLSLSTVLLGILCLQWIRAYQKKENLSPQEFLKIRQVRYEGFENWKVSKIVASLPTLLLVALVLFFAGVIDFLTTLHRGVAIAVAGVAGTAVFALIFTTVLPAFLMFFRVVTMNGDKPTGSQCPYKSAQSWAFFRLFYLPISFFLFTFKGRSWGHKEPRRFQSRRENLYQVALSQSWSHYDIASKFLQGVGIDSPMSWIAKAFNQTYNSVAIIYSCFRDIEVGAAWSAYWRINGTPEPTTKSTDNMATPISHDVLRDLASEALLNYFSRTSEVRQTRSLVLHHFELYNRILGSGQPLGDLPLAGSYTPQCPDLSWREYGIYATMNTPPYVQLETLYNLLALITQPQHNIQYHEIRTIWQITYWILQSLDVPGPVPSILTSVFQALKTRLPTIQTSAISDPSLGINMADFCRAFHDQLAFPATRNQFLVSHGSIFRLRLSAMFEDPDFRECLALMTASPHFIDPRSTWQVQTWENLSKIMNETTDGFGSGSNPASRNRSTWSDYVPFDTLERVRMTSDAVGAASFLGFGQPASPAGWGSTHSYPPYSRYSEFPPASMPLPNPIGLDVPYSNSPNIYREISVPRPFLPSTNQYSPPPRSFSTPATATLPSVWNAWTDTMQGAPGPSTPLPDEPPHLPFIPPTPTISPSSSSHSLTVPPPPPPLSPQRTPSGQRDSLDPGEYISNVLSTPVRDSAHLFLQGGSGHHTPIAEEELEELEEGQRVQY